MPNWEGRGVHEHPGVEMLSAYVDGALGDHERAAVEAHLASCEECVELVTEVMHVMPEEAVAGGVVPEGAASPTPTEPARVLPFTRRRWVWAVASLAAIVALALRIGWFTRTALSPDDQAAAGRLGTLMAAVEDTRTVDARLSGFQFAEFQPPHRGGSAPQGNLRLVAAAGEAQRAMEIDPSPRNAHVLGVAHVLLGNHDEAIQLLERSVSAAPSLGATVLNDLGVAYIARASARDLASDWPRALDAVDRCLRLDATFLEAKFNRAVILEQLGLVETAEAEWQAYLAVDASSPWADQARRRLDLLRARQKPVWDLQRERQMPDASQVNDVVRLSPGHARGPDPIAWTGNVCRSS